MSKDNKKWFRTKTATTVKRDGDSGYCQYHDTVVAQWTDKEITLDLGDWDTMMTRGRMNQVIRYEELGDVLVYREKKQTFVCYYSGHYCNKETIRVAFGGEYQPTVTIPRGSFKGWVEDCPDCGMKKLRDIDA